MIDYIDPPWGPLLLPPQDFDESRLLFFAREMPEIRVSWRVVLYAIGSHKVDQ